MIFVVTECCPEPIPIKKEFLVKSVWPKITIYCEIQNQFSTRTVELLSYNTVYHHTSLSPVVILLTNFSSHFTSFLLMSVFFSFSLIGFFLTQVFIHYNKQTFFRYNHHHHHHPVVASFRRKKMAAYINVVLYFLFSR